MTRRFLLTAVVPILIAFLCPSAPAHTLQVADLSGRTVEAPANPERVIAVGSGALRLLCYLEAADRVVGVEYFDKKFFPGRSYQLTHPSLARLPAIGAGGPAQINRDPDLEAVLRLAPEIIFITFMEKAKAEDLQKRLGIPVVALAYSKKGVGRIDENFSESLRLAGKILGKEERAEAVIDFIEHSRRDLLARTEGVPRDLKPRIYVGGISLKGAQGITSTDTGYLPFEWIGGRNLAGEGDHSGHLFINREQLLLWNPDILFIDAGGLELMVQDYRRKPEMYRNLQAIRDGQTYLLYPFNNYSTNVETIIADAYAAGKILYPEKFADIDIAEVSDKIYTFFLGKPVYGEMKKSFGDLGRIFRFQ